MRRRPPLAATTTRLLPLAVLICLACTSCRPARTGRTSCFVDGAPRRQQQQRRTATKSDSTAPDDYYKILGVKRTAKPKDIKKAYRKLALVRACIRVCFVMSLSDGWIRRFLGSSGCA